LHLRATRSTTVSTGIRLEGFRQDSPRHLSKETAIQIDCIMMIEIIN
jgi:hypothetical protein